LWCCLLSLLVTSGHFWCHLWLLVVTCGCFWCRFWLLLVTSVLFLVTFTCFLLVLCCLTDLLTDLLQILIPPCVSWSSLGSSSSQGPLSKWVLGMLFGSLETQFATEVPQASSSRSGGSSRGTNKREDFSFGLLGTPRSSQQS
jgi:hypothetical protein